ncbi:MAG: hypothetical protein CME65_12180 [Halobacteriovoraceae bacterium]|nr:hypothetical protein [Halobacteriovoraceae bacterium]|tara:strand:+ start:1148 stop:1549 length:402 start_codon:yes stop_codon:yes gene_type:complete
MGVVIALSIILHTALLLSSIGVFWYTARKESFQYKDWLIYIGVTFVAAFLNVSLVALAVMNIEALQGSKSAVYGYTAFPVIPIVLLLMTYPAFQLLKRKNSFNVKYSSVFWGIVLSAPLGHALGAAVSILEII